MGDNPRFGVARMESLFTGSWFCFDATLAQSTDGPTESQSPWKKNYMYL